MELLGSGTPRRVVFTKLTEGEKLPDAVSDLLSQLNVEFAYISAIGGFAEARLAVFEASTSTYHYVEVKPPEGYVLEVVTLTGNGVTGPDGKYYLHLHALVARKPGEIYGGHLVSAVVKPFLELMVIELPGQLKAKEGLKHRWEGRFNYVEEKT